MEWTEDLEEIATVAYARFGEQVVNDAVARAVQCACAQSLLAAESVEPANRSDRRRLNLQRGAFEAALLAELRRLLTPA